MLYTAGEVMGTLQMEQHRKHSALLKLSLFVLVFMGHVANATPLTLKQAEQAALSQSPEVRSLRAKTEALGQSAIASGQLSDPKLMLGVMNVPVDTFNFNQEPMTQVQVGLMQAFPRGRSLHYKSLQTYDLSVAELHKQQVMRLQVLRGVQLSWLNLYYWIQTKQIVLKQKNVFQHLVKITESMLANNKAQQKNVIRAQLELTELDNQLLNINQQIKTARATLGRWIGPALAKEAAPKQLPNWLSPPTRLQFQHDLAQHPILKTDAALISSGYAGVKLAEQQYKPGFTVGVAYGFRQGRSMDAQRRSDFLTMQVSMDIPLFTHNRQDRTLRASQENLLSNEENQMSDYRQLLETLKTQYAAWQQQHQSACLYRSKLIPKAKQYAEATMTAYQNTQTDFPTLARAYVHALNTELGGLKALVYQHIARANLLYLQGR